MDLGGVGDAATVDGAAPDAGSGRGWRDGARMPGGPRQEASAAAIGDEVYVLGGFGPDGRLLRRVEVYDAQADRWRPATDLPLAMNHANVASVGGRILVLGFLDRHLVPDRRGFTYEPATDAWTPGPDLPPASARGDTGVAVDGTRVYLAGGIAARAQPIVHVFDASTATWSRLPDLPEARDHMAAGAIDGVVYVAGGRGAEGGALLDSTWAFTAATGWTSRSGLAGRRGVAASAVLGGRLYAFGGESDDPGGLTAAVEAYDPAVDRWARLPDLPEALHGAAAAAAAEQIVVAGGATALGHAPTDAVRLFTP